MKKTAKKTAKKTSKKRAKPDVKRPARDASAEREALRALVRTLEKDKARLEEQLANVEAECKRYFEQFVDVEVASTNVANLYVASLRLHSTLDRDDVLAAIHEIVNNLVGSEELCVFEVAGDRRALRLVSSVGVDARAWQSVPFGAGIVGRAAATGEAWVADDGGGTEERGPNEAHLTAAIPLVVEGRVVGAIAIFRLLGHKHGLEDVDHELFTLLRTQAANALYCSALARTSALHAIDAVQKNA